MMKLKVKEIMKNYFDKQIFLLASVSAPNDIILTTDNLDEKLDSAIEGLRNKEYED